MNASAPAIEVQDLTKRYGETLAVDAVEFSVGMGGTVGLLGGNGAGKTTTIAMLLGLLVPTAGRITVLGHDIAGDRYRALAAAAGEGDHPYVEFMVNHELTVLRFAELAAAGDDTAAAEVVLKELDHPWPAGDGPPTPKSR